MYNFSSFKKEEATKKTNYADINDRRKRNHSGTRDNYPAGCTKIGDIHSSLLLSFFFIDGWFLSDVYG